jgi:hypothetical protein
MTPGRRGKDEYEAEARIIPQRSAGLMQRTNPNSRERTKKEAAMSPWRP